MISLCGCGPVCTLFSDGFGQCHGNEVEPDVFEEPINGFDVTGNYYSDVDEIFVHHALKIRGRCEGWLQADVPADLDDHPRIFVTKDFPQSFSLRVDSQPPAVGDKWRIGWLTASGEALGMQIEGPETEDDLCSFFRLVNLSCADVEELDRKIPFYFLGNFDREMSVLVCIHEPLGLIILTVVTRSKAIVDGVLINTDHTFSHHLPYGAESSECDQPLKCYPLWLEVDKGAPGSYEFNAIAFGKSRGISNLSLISGVCNCHAVGDPVFSDDFGRANETIDTSLAPHDSTGHWFPIIGPWYVLSSELKTSIPCANPADAARIHACDHFTGTSPGFVLFGWDLPLTCSVKMKLPEDGEGHLYVIDSKGYRAALKTGASGRLALLEAANVNAASFTVLSEVDIPDVPAGEWHTVTWCYNGRVMFATVLLSDGRSFSVHVEKEITFDTSTIWLVVPSQSSGNADGDYFFDDFKVWAANDVTPLDVGYGYGYGYGDDDQCPCCGPTGCQESPPLASDPESCFWALPEAGTLVYQGSYSGVGGDCGKDDTTKFDVSFTVTDSSGSITLTVGGASVVVTFDDGFGEGTIQVGDVVHTIDALPVDSFNQIHLCIGKGTVVGDVNGNGITTTGEAGEGQPTITWSGATIEQITNISHNIYSPSCEDCFGLQIVECSETDKANCAGGVVGPLTADFEFGMDDPNDLCCAELAAVLHSGLVLKTTGTASVTIFDGILQCVYCFGGGALVPCEAASNPDKLSASVCLERTVNGYRLSGTLSISGTGPGGSLQGTFTGHSDIIAELDEDVDCTQLAGSIPLNVWAPAASPSPPCGLRDVVMTVGAA